ncbi:hypothetical protein A2U01_0086758, partial [Trifolium medium]|nr:hypothetical protein [Trifolium medium]
MMRLREGNKHSHVDVDAACFE